MKTFSSEAQTDEAREGLPRANFKQPCGDLRCDTALWDRLWRGFKRWTTQDGTFSTGLSFVHVCANSERATTNEHLYARSLMFGRIAT